MRAWYERWQAEKTFRRMRHFYDLNHHKWDATETAYFVLSMDLVRSVMYKDYRK